MSLENLNKATKRLIREGPKLIDIPSSTRFDDWRPFTDGTLWSKLVWQVKITYPSGSIRPMVFYVHSYISAEDAQSVFSQESLAFELLQSKLWLACKSAERIRRFYNKGVVLMLSGKRRWVGIGAVEEIPYGSQVRVVEGKKRPRDLES
jgi:hypothetical protein